MALELEDNTETDSLAWYGIIGMAVDPKALPSSVCAKWKVIFHRKGNRDDTTRNPDGELSSFVFCQALRYVRALPMPRIFHLVHCQINQTLRSMNTISHMPNN